MEVGKGRLYGSPDSYYEFLCLNFEKNSICWQHCRRQCEMLHVNKKKIAEGRVFLHFMVLCCAADVLAP